MCTSNRVWIGAVAAMLWAVGAAAYAGIPQLSDGDLQFHGFISQGYTVSSGNNVNGHSSVSGGSLQFHELGANASYRPRGDLLFAAQLASVRAGDAIRENLIVEYGLVDFSPVQGEDGRLGLRLGKLKLPIGFYNDSRDAVFTRPSILLPQGVYLDNSGARSFGYFSLLGAQAYADWYAGAHAVYVEVGGYGRQDLGDTAAIAILRQPASGRFDIRRGGILRIADDYDGGRFRSALSLSSVSIHYNPGAAPPFAQAGDLDFRQAALSLQYNWAQLSLTSEYVVRRFKLDDLVPGPYNSATDISPGGFYLQGAYRWTPRLQWLLRYDEQRRDMGDPNGDKQAAGTTTPNYYFFARDWTLGTRYDWCPDLSLWAEVHRIDGVSWVNPLDNADFNNGRADRHWTLFTMMAGYRF